VFNEALELRFMQADSTIAQPSTGKQVSLAVDQAGVIRARYFNGNAWVGL
jgi:DNA-binding protein